jgi:lipoprotein-anchoring transpeptidase ErfK/SrfK
MRYYSLLFITIIIILSAGCSAPRTPTELKYAEAQKTVLLKAGVSNYAPDEYKNYVRAYWDSINALEKEESRYRYLRDYTSVRDQFQLLLGKGNRLLAEINRKKAAKAQDIEKRIYTLKDRIASLKASTSLINEARLIRKSLSKAEVLLAETEFLYKKGDFSNTEINLNRISKYATESTVIANSILSRYSDSRQIAKWQKLVESTIVESRNRGIIVFIVSKIDQSLMVYKNGRKLKTYDVGLGRNGLKDKLYAGDGATPEGKYFIVKKNAGSRYYKALLFNYPNKEDQLRFAQARKKGLIPSRAGIGSLLEIHGGGSDGMTKGCISLENNDMEKLFSLATEGTPVTIVGAVNGYNEALSYIE